MEDTNREKVILTVVLTLAESFVGYLLHRNNIFLQKIGEETIDLSVLREKWEIY